MISFELNAMSLVFFGFLHGLMIAAFMLVIVDLIVKRGQNDRRP